MRGLEDLNSVILNSLRKKRGQPVIDPSMEMDLTGPEPMLGMNLEPRIDPSVEMDLTGAEPMLAMNLERKPAVDSSLFMDLTGSEPMLTMDTNPPPAKGASIYDLPPSLKAADVGMKQAVSESRMPQNLDFTGFELDEPEISISDPVVRRGASMRDASPASISKRTGPGEYWDLKGAEPVLRSREMDFSGFAFDKTPTQKPEYDFELPPVNLGRLSQYEDKPTPGLELPPVALGDLSQYEDKPDSMSALQERIAGIKGAADAVGETDVSRDFNEYLRGQAPTVREKPTVDAALAAAASEKEEREQRAEAERMEMGVAGGSPATSTDEDVRPDRAEYDRRAALQHLFNVTPALFGRPLQKVTAEDDYRADLKDWLERRQQRQSEASKLKQAERLKELEMLTRRGEGESKRAADLEKTLIGQQGMMDRLLAGLGGKSAEAEAGRGWKSGENEKDRELRERLAKMAAARAAAARGAAESRMSAAASAKGETQSFKDSSALRREYYNQPVVKRADVVDETVKRLLASAGDDTGASDMRVLYSYMKLLDPDTGVREGELATGSQAGKKLSESLVSLYNRIVEGERLTPAQRNEYRKQAKLLAKQHQDKLSELQKQYTKIAESRGLNPEYVVGSPMLSLRDDVGKSAAPAAKQPSGGLITMVNKDGDVIKALPDEVEEFKGAGYHEKR